MLQTHLSIKYLVRLPKVSHKKSILIILLHGYGSNEDDLFSFANDFPDQFLVISLRAIRNSPMGGYAWYDINFLNNEKFTDTKQAKESIFAIKLFIEELKNQYEFDAQNIYMCGFSQGAILSYALGLHYPEMIKKVICLSGCPDKNSIENTNKDYSQSQFFISHGTQDTMIPVEWGSKGEVLMKELNISYRYKEYNAGHGINADNYRDMMLWIKETLSCNV